MGKQKKRGIWVVVEAIAWMLILTVPAGFAVWLIIQGYLWWLSALAGAGVFLLISLFITVCVTIAGKIKGRKG